MKAPTYKEQFDKLTRAYIANEVEPYDNCACFVGNLLNNTDKWAYCRSALQMKAFINPESEHFRSSWEVSTRSISDESGGMYNAEEIVKLEQIFMETYIMKWRDVLIVQDLASELMRNPGKELKIAHEQGLFDAFVAALDELKRIHISKGEDVEEQMFTRRPSPPGKV